MIQTEPSSSFDLLIFLLSFALLSYLYYFVSSKRMENCETLDLCTEVLKMNNNEIK